MRAVPSAHRSSARLAAAVGLTVLVAAPVAAQAPAEQLPPGKELIAKFVTATNTTPVMAKHSSVRTKGRVEIPSAGMGGDLEISQARPNKSMLRINIPGLGEIARGFDGTNGWSLDPMEGPRVLGGRELDAMREESSFGTSSRQGPNVASAETLEKTSMNGEACYKVKIVWKSGRETFDCYSTVSGLMVASVSKQDTPMGSVEVTNLISDYKDFGGQKVATRLTQQVMGNEQVMTITSVDYDAAGAATFEMPASIRTLTEKKP